jgi:hypothetical protein
VERNVALKVVGAGVGRTGTASLKLALERLLGGRCYHMQEIAAHPEALEYWAAAGRGEMPDWDTVFAGYVATVDWPSATYWPEISAAYPEALVLLSVRVSPEVWWQSATATIFDGMRERVAAGGDAFAAMAAGIFQRFPPGIADKVDGIAAYKAHNERVRGVIPSSRLLEWQPGDGWGPLCERLGVAVPDEPFPHENTTERFREHSRQMSARDDSEESSDVSAPQA